MPIDRKTVEYVAHLARIELKENELNRLSGQLKAILDYIDCLKAVKITDIPPTSHILSLNNVFRQDKPKDALSAAEALENAPQKNETFFEVPKVIE